LRPKTEEKHSERYPTEKLVFRSNDGAPRPSEYAFPVVFADGDGDAEATASRRLIVRSFGKDENNQTKKTLRLADPTDFVSVRVTGGSVSIHADDI